MKNHVILLFKLTVIASSISTTAVTALAVIARPQRGRSNPVTYLVKRLRLRIASSLAFFAMMAGAMTVVVGAFPAHAQPTQPADSCNAGEAGRYRLSGGPIWRGRDIC